MPRRTFKVEVTLLAQMDDTTPDEAREVIMGRVNEMLAVLERKDDVRIVLVRDEVRET